MTTYELPLDEDRTGGVVAELRLTGEPVSWANLVSLAELLHRARHKVTLVFATDGPPPQFIGRSHVAKMLGTTDYHVRKLTQAGHLHEVLWNEGLAQEKPTVNGGPDPTCPYTKRLYRFDEVLDLATRAKQTGHLPVVSPERLPRKASSPRRRAPRGEPVNVTALVLREAYPRALTKLEIQQAVRAYYSANADTRTVGLEAIHKQVKAAMAAGQIRNVAAPKVVQFNQPKGRYRWIGDHDEETDQ